VDVEPFVQRWLHQVVGARGLAPHTVDTYERNLRVLIPAGEAFPRSRLSEDYIQSVLRNLRRPDGKSVSGSSRRAHFNTWRQFYRWARKRVPLLDDPFDDLEPPRRSPSRTTYWEFTRIQEVLAAVPPGQMRVALTLIFGTGIELGAVLNLRGQHVLGGDENKLIVPGTKTEFRRDRIVFVDAWAWPTFYEHARQRGASELLFDPEVVGMDGRMLREALYDAQVRRELIAPPPVSTAGRRLWGEVKKHDIHDARHSYAMNRLLGLDGDPAQSIEVCRQPTRTCGRADGHAYLRQVPS